MFFEKSIGQADYFNVVYLWPVSRALFGWWRRTIFKCWPWVHAKRGASVDV
jgi:hypothetical protein